MATGLDGSPHTRWARRKIPWRMTSRHLATVGQAVLGVPGRPSPPVDAEDVASRDTKRVIARRHVPERRRGRRKADPASARISDGADGAVPARAGRYR